MDDSVVEDAFIAENDYENEYSGLEKFKSTSDLYDFKQGRNRKNSTGSADTFPVENGSVTGKDLDGADDVEIQILTNENRRLRRIHMEYRACLIEYEKKLTSKADELDKMNANDPLEVYKRDHEAAVKEIAKIGSAYGELQKRLDGVLSLIDVYKSNETALKENVSSMHQWLIKHEELNKVLSNAVDNKLSKIDEDIKMGTVNSQNEIERFNASKKVLELQIQSVRSQLEQKSNENRELTSICEQLLNKNE